MVLKTGDALLVVEHDEATKAPRDGGKRYPARVVGAEGIYVQVTYDDQAVNRGGLADVFYKESGWRAWDGALRWRLIPEEA
jgi:hypothetical protein